MARKAKPKQRADLVQSILDPATMELGPVRPTTRERKAIAKRLQMDGASVDIGNALRYLVVDPPAPEDVALAAGFLLDKKQSGNVRRQAAAALARAPGKEADKALAKALKDAARIGEAPLLAALAKAGGSAGLKALRKLDTPATPQTARMRAYAETAISYRLGEKPSATAEQAAFPVARPVPIVREGKATMAAAVAALEGRPYGLEFRDDIGFSFDCAGGRHVVLLNAALEPGRFVDAVRGARMIAAIIALDDGRSGRLVERSVVFLRPEKPGARLSVVRPSGDVVMAGRLTRRGDGMDLSLRSLKNTGWPVDVQGRVTAKTLELSASVFDAAVRVKRSGDAVPHPEIGKNTI